MAGFKRLLVHQTRRPIRGLKLKLAGILTSIWAQFKAFPASGFCSRTLLSLATTDSRSAMGQMRRLRLIKIAHGKRLDLTQTAKNGFIQTQLNRANT